MLMQMCSQRLPHFIFMRTQKNNTAKKARGASNATATTQTNVAILAGALQEGIIKVDTFCLSEAINNATIMLNRVADYEIDASEVCKQTLELAKLNKYLFQDIIKNTDCRIEQLEDETERLLKIAHKIQ
jgi:hypothetical protein